MSAAERIAFEDETHAIIARRASGPTGPAPAPCEIESQPVDGPPGTPDGDSDGFVNDDPLAGADEDEAGSTLSPAERESKRLERKPSIDHLPDGTTYVAEVGTLALFQEGDNIVVERRSSLLQGNPWLDTRVYRVRAIDDETGVVSCVDEEFPHRAFIGMGDPLTIIKLCPKKGDPFKVPRVKTPALNSVSPGPAPAAGAKKRGRGRPPGSKNRPKDVIKAEKQARRQDRTNRAK